jgi:hypothetical protein
VKPTNRSFNLKSVDVAGYYLKVEQHSQGAITRKMGKTPLGLPYFGYLEPHERIVINKNLPLQEKWETLIHEIGHEVQFIIAPLTPGECDIANESVHHVYNRLLVGALFSNGIIR